MFYIYTLGCKVNQYESQALREAWTALGHSESEGPEEAALILINSCGVTSRAVADLRAAVRRLRRAAPAARIIVSGCAARLLAQSKGKQAEADGLILQQDKAALLAAWPLDRNGQVLFGASGNRADNSPDNAPLFAPSGGIPDNTVFFVRPDDEAAASRPGMPGQEASRPVPSFPPFSLNSYNRSRAVLKIQDGCSHGCAYCFVPLARGGARSRPYGESLAEAKRLLDAGFREIVVSGVNLRQYTEPGKGDFWDFIARLDAALAPRWAGRARLRLSSLEPGQLGGKALETLATARLVAPHLHVSLQSGSPSVLARMGRSHYDPATLPFFLEGLNRIWPRYGLGADILCGFPGESDEEAVQSLELVRSLPLTYAHVFPYSRRPGTRAADLPGQLPKELIKARAAEVRTLAEGKKKEFLRSLLEAERLEVVLDQGKDSGPDQHYADCFLERRAPQSPDLPPDISPAPVPDMPPLPAPASDISAPPALSAAPSPVLPPPPFRAKPRPGELLAVRPVGLCARGLIVRPLERA